MAFRFPLATVLRLRESVEKREERALQKIQAEIARVVHQIEDLTQQMENEKAAREQLLRKSLPAGHLHTMLWEVESAEEKKKALLALLQVLEEQRTQQLNIYQAAHRDRETLTDMREQHRDAYDVEQSRKQQKVLDDIFIARHHRS